LCGRVVSCSVSEVGSGGVRIELATDQPGMTVDEGPADLGTRLVLPSWLQARRTELACRLPPLRLPGATPHENTAP
jgi:hypothetical protein